MSNITDSLLPEYVSIISETDKDFEMAIEKMIKYNPSGGGWYRITNEVIDLATFRTPGNWIIDNVINAPQKFVVYNESEEQICAWQDLELPISMTIQDLGGVTNHEILACNDILVGVTHISYIMVGYGTILTSPDGITWTKQTSGFSANLYSIAYANNLFVAVGSGGILTSPDGITWTKLTSGVSADLRSVIYANNLFVAVGYGIVLTSPDGITWTKQESGTSATLNSVTYGKNLFVAVGNSGTIVTSPDSITWTKQTSGVIYEAFYSITYGNNLFVAVGKDGFIRTSPDGITWTNRESAAINALNSVTYGNNLYVAVGYDGAILTSPDGITWAKQISGVNGILYYVTYGNNRFIALMDSKYILTSPDGIVWDASEHIPPYTEIYYIGHWDNSSFDFNFTSQNFAEYTRDSYSTNTSSFLFRGKTTPVLLPETDSFIGYVWVTETLENGADFLIRSTDAHSKWQNVHYSGEMLKSIYDPNHHNTDPYQYIMDQINNLSADLADYLKHKANELNYIHTTADEKLKYASKATQDQLSELYNITTISNKQLVEKSYEDELHLTRSANNYKTSETSFNNHNIFGEYIGHNNLGILRSDNGVAWQNIPGFSTSAINQILVRTNRDILVSGKSPTTSATWRSVDLLSWDVVTSKIFVKLFELPNDGATVIIGVTSDCMLYTSTDGQTWTYSSTVPFTILTIKYHQPLNTYLVVASDGVYSGITLSSWTKVFDNADTRATLNDICTDFYVDHIPCIVAAGYNSSADTTGVVYYTSENSITWTKAALPDGVKRCLYVETIAAQVCLVTTTAIYTSATGITWTHRFDLREPDISLVRTSRGGIMLHSLSTLYMVTSEDGVTWSETHPNVTIQQASYRSGYHISEDDINAWNNKANVNHKHETDDRVELDASNITTGTLLMARFATDKRLRRVTVPDSITYATQLQNDYGPTHSNSPTLDQINIEYQRATSSILADKSSAFYYITDRSKMFSDNYLSGIVEYTSSPRESGLNWDRIINLPTTISGYGISDEIYTKTAFDQILSPTKAQLLTSIPESTEKLTKSIDDSLAMGGSVIIDNKFYPTELFVYLGYYLDKDLVPNIRLYTQNKITNAFREYRRITAPIDYTEYSNIIEWRWSTTNIDGETGLTKIVDPSSTDLPARFVAVGNSGIILTSPDAITWTKQISGITDNFFSITYGNNLFVATGGNSGTILTSPDAITWTKQISNITAQLRSVAYGNNLYVSVGQLGVIITSPDAITWTRRYSDATSTLYSIGYYNNRYIAAEFTGNIILSIDGITWERYACGTSSIEGVTYGNGIFVAVGSIGSRITTSFDGITWTKQTSGISVNLRTIIYINGIFVVGGDSGTILTSTDGITWTKRVSGITNGRIFSIVYGKNLYVAFGENGAISTSPDAITWTASSTGYSVNMLDGVYQSAYDKSDVFAAVNDGKLMLSLDGASWKEGLNIDPTREYHLTDLPILFIDHRYYALWYPNVYTSYDGCIWTKRNTYSELPFTPRGGIVVGTRIICWGPGGVCITDTHVINWKYYSLGSTSGAGEMIYNDGLYVMVGAGFNAVAMTSADAITWTRSTTRTGDPFYSVTYGNGIYVAVGMLDLITNGYIYTSPDAMTWTKQAYSDNALYSVAFYNNLYVAVGSEGMIVTSTDGITWTKRTSNTDHTLSTVTGGNGLYMTVANDGIVLTSRNGIDWTMEKNPGNLYPALFMHQVSACGFSIEQNGARIMESKPCSTDPGTELAEQNFFINKANLLYNTKQIDILRAVQDGYIPLIKALDVKPSTLEPIIGAFMPE